MGDICDLHDIERFMRSNAGKSHLAELRQALVGRTITDVTFANEIDFIATTLHLDDGDTFFIAQPSLQVEAIRKQFEEVLEAEYYADYPERKPV